MRRRLWLEPLDRRDVPAVYYVAPTGDDGAAGTTDDPWRTLQHAADAVTAGDRVVVRAGTYAGFNLTTDGTAAAPITFAAEAGVLINTPNPDGPHAGRDGINVEGADHAVIDGFTVVGMPRAGIRVVTNTGAVIRNNTADLNGRWGILTGFAQNVTIENNVCSRSQLEHGIYVSNSADNPVVRGNTSWGNAACGIHMNSDRHSGGDGVITGALIENNVIYDNGRLGGSGINMDGVSRSRVQNNLLYGNHSTGIALYRIDGTHGAWNNVIANNTVLTAADGRWSLLITNGSTGNRVFNNILLNDHSFRGSMSVSPDSLTGFRSDYNVVADRFTTTDGETRLTLAQWRARYGRDAHSAVAAAPELFVDPANNDFRLLPGGPAVDRGVRSLGTALAPIADRLGAWRPDGGGFDVGAHEVVTATPPIGPPVVTIGDGTGQRSLVRSISLLFDTLVTFDPGAVRLVRVGGEVPTQTHTVTEEGGRTRLTVTFRGTGTNSGSLMDGNWVLKVLRARVHRADAAHMTMAADLVHKFYRLYGDSDGDRDVDATDRAAFDAAFGQTDAASLGTFDFDNDGDVDAADRNKFNLRFGRRV